MHDASDASALPQPPLSDTPARRTYHSAAEAMEALLKPMASVYERFPGLDNALLLKEIFKVYCVKKGVTVRWFNEKGEANATSHPENQRPQDQVIVNLVESHLTLGASWECRGECGYYIQLATSNQARRTIAGLRSHVCFARSWCDVAKRAYL